MKKKEKRKIFKMTSDIKKKKKKAKFSATHIQIQSPGRKGAGSCGGDREIWVVENLKSAYPSEHFWRSSG